MSGISFFSENLVDFAEISISSGAQDGQFPLLNLQNDSPSIKFRSTGNTVTIVLDLLQTREIDTIAVHGDPTETLGITSMVVKTSVTPDFTLSTPTNITLSSEYNMGYEYITLVNHRFVEIEFTGGGSFCEVGNIFIGKRINLPLNAFSVNSFNYQNTDPSRIVQNPYGVRYIDNYPFRKTLSGTIEFCNKEEQEILDNMFLYHGRVRPLWVVVDSSGAAINDGQYKLVNYGYIANEPVWTASGGQLYNITLEVDQAI